MSLYNMLFGVNSMSGVLMRVLDVKAPRFRDCWYDPLAKTIIVFTRTGGGNRDYYESEARCRESYPELFEDADPPSGPWNDDMRAHPQFVSDSDNERDSTYAQFVFDLPPEFEWVHEWFMRNESAQGEREPGKLWEEFYDKLENDKTDSAVQRVKTFLTPMIAQIRHIREEVKRDDPPDEEVAND